MPPCPRRDDDPRTLMLDGAARWLVWLLVAYVSGRVVLDVVNLEDGLSPVADAFSEANVVRAAEYHAVAGLTSDYGLSNTVYGRQFKREGHRGKGKDAHEVYTHYPPGPDLTASVARLVFGKGELGLFRSIPVAVGILCLAFLAASLLRVLTPTRAAWVIGGVAILPLTWNMMAGLCYQGYALSLLWAQLGIALRLFARSEGELAQRRALGPAAWWMFGLGFLQGWLSFDYFFLVALSPLPIFAAFHAFGDRAARRHLGMVLLAATGGFAFAHGLHFLQVALYWGSLGEAWTDLMTSAVQRFDNSIRNVARVSEEELNPLWLAWRYVSLYSSHELFFGLPFALCLGGAALLLIPRCKLPGSSAAGPWIWRGGPSRLVPLALALVVSLLWVMVMRQHSAIHTHFIPRHLFLAWFVALLLLARAPQRSQA